jgi:hypothetical protein
MAKFVLDLCLFCKKKRIIKSKERFALDFESKRGKPNRK